MEITIASHKFRLEILILIVVAFWIMFGHLLCGCSRVGFKEGLEMMKTIAIAKKPSIAIANNNSNNSNNSNKPKIAKEGFVSSSPEFANVNDPGYIIKPADWSVSPEKMSHSIANRPNVPLPKGEMDIFANTEFKPECCPNTYSNSSGCACMNEQQYIMLKSRGSNNVPISEY